MIYLPVCSLIWFLYAHSTDCLDRIGEDGIHPLLVVSHTPWYSHSNERMTKKLLPAEDKNQYRSAKSKMINSPFSENSTFILGNRKKIIGMSKNRSWNLQSIVFFKILYNAACNTIGLLDTERAILRAWSNDFTHQYYLGDVVWLYLVGEKSWVFLTNGDNRRYLATGLHCINS